MTLSGKFAPEEATRRRKLKCHQLPTYSTLYVPQLTKVHSFTFLGNLIMGQHLAVGTHGLCGLYLQPERIHYGIASGRCRRVGNSGCVA